MLFVTTLVLDLYSDVSQEVSAEPAKQFTCGENSSARVKVGATLGK